MPLLVESPLHSFLKRVGVAFLLNRGCFLVDTEVPLGRLGQRRIHDPDEHHVIDVCGVGERFIRSGSPIGGWDHGNRGCEVRQNILRGIEVKVSRSDFRNGFVSSGCNYNYLLTPMRLVAPSSLPRFVGLIEYNRYKFSAELTEEGAFAFRGLRVVRKPVFRRISPHQVDNATSLIVRRRHLGDPERIIGELIEGQSRNGYDHKRALNSGVDPVPDIGPG